MIQIILDTNLWLDWLLFNDKGIALLKEKVVERQVQLLDTQAMYDELEDVLSRPSIGEKFLARSSHRSVNEMLNEYSLLVTRQNKPFFTERIPLCRDANDQMYVELAISSKASIVTKDRALLHMNKVLFSQYGVRTMSLKAFTEKLAQT